MRVAVGDVRLYFDVEGCGLAAQGEVMAERPALVLLHGGPGADHSFFKPEFSAMADLAQVLYLDQRGSGRSDRGEPGTWTWRHWADDVAGFCAAVELSGPVLVGVSSGGRVAVECALRHPGLARGLVLDSVLAGHTSLADSLAVFGRRGGPAARDAAARYLAGDTSPEATASWEARALPLYGSASDGDMTARRARALINDDVQERFRRGGCGPLEITAAQLDAIDCPVLLLAGEDDPVAPAASVLRLARSVTRAAVQVHVLAGVGHGAFRQAPAQAFAALRAFLRDAIPPTPGEGRAL